MEDVFSLNLDTRTDIDSLMRGKAWDDYNESLKEIECYLYSEPYLEDFVSNDIKGLTAHAKNARKNMDPNTKKALDAGVKSYYALTNTTGAAMQTSWTVFFRSANLVSTALLFISGVLEKIPGAVNKIADSLERIPAEIRRKIRGDIELYVNVDDFEVMYGQGLVAKLKDYCTALDAITKSKGWPDLRNGLRGLVINIWANDEGFRRNIKTVNTMASQLGKVTFTKRLVKLNNAETVEKYFIAGDAVHFVDRGGHDKTMSYIGALEFLANDLKSMKDEVHDLKEKFNIKKADTSISEEFAKLPNYVQRDLQMISVYASTSIGANLGKLIKCVLADIKTIKHTINRARSIYSKMEKPKDDES